MIKIDWKDYFTARVIFGFWWTMYVNDNSKTLRLRWNWYWPNFEPADIPWYRCWTWEGMWTRQKCVGYKPHD